MADTDPLSPAESATVPAVVAVVVTHEPGPWLEDCIGALAAQDYPNLSVLILDAGSTEDPTRRVAEVLPGAFVRRLGRNPGYAAATNDVLEVVEGASHLLLCHDDVAPDADVVRLLVEEAYRSNAGIVAPKLVDWDDPSRLLQVGMTTDKMGMPVPLVERGEMDQEQHDSVRDVFCAPSGCMLVRADLFKSLGGFDAAMTFCGEDVDLSWRAQIAGARVLVVPAARARHREASRDGTRLPPGIRKPADLEVLRLRHALRSVLKSYGPWHRLRVLPQAFAISIFRVVSALVTGHPKAAAGVISAWRWNRAKENRAAVKQARRAIHSSRAMSDGETRRLQSRGTAGINTFARVHHLTGDEQGRLVEAAGRGVAAAVRPPATVAAALAVGLVLAFGTRSLISGNLAAVGEQLALPDSPFDALRLYASGWRFVGLGGAAPSPPAFAFIGLAGSLLFGAMATLQKILVLGLIPLGLVGASRMSRPLGSARPRITVLVAYAAIPVPWNSLAGGRWSGLIAWAVIPWAIAALARVADGTGGTAGGSEGGSAKRTVIGLGIGLGIAGAFAPVVLLLVAVGALGMWAGSALTGRESTLPLRTVGVALGAAGVGAALLLPWSATTLATPSPTIGPVAFDALLRFETGPLGGPPAGWVWLLAGALPLVIGRSWRLRWAAAAWGLAVVGWLLAWVAGRDWVPLPLGSSESALALSAAGLALAAGLGVLAFELDLPAYRFGWRQVAPPAVALAIFIGVVPVVGATLGGRWDQPERDLAGSLSFVSDGERAEEGDFRILWLGDPAAVPGQPWRLAGFPGTAFTLSRNGVPEGVELWPGAPPGATGAVGRALHLATDVRTTQLGRLLAPMAVRYIAVARRAAPDTRAHPLPTELVTGLDRQVDLGRIETEDVAILYENAAWIPARSFVPGGTSVDGGPAAAASADLAGAAGAFADGDDPVPSGFSGDAEAGTRLLLAESPSAGWRLTTSGSAAAREAAFDVANAWDIEVGGAVTLRYRNPIVQWVVLAIQLAAWALASRWVWKLWRSRRRRVKVTP